MQSRSARARTALQQCCHLLHWRGRVVAVLEQRGTLVRAATALAHPPQLHHRLAASDLTLQRRLQPTQARTQGCCGRSDAQSRTHREGVTTHTTSVTTLEARERARTGAASAKSTDTYVITQAGRTSSHMKPWPGAHANARKVPKKPSRVDPLGRGSSSSTHTSRILRSLMRYLHADRTTW
jgi:hypothetical protein